MEREVATLYRAEKLDDLFVFQANYQKFTFCKHSHEDFALGLMFQGTQKLHCRGECFYAGPGSLITVNADEIHDGMSADGQTYKYKIIYLPESILREIGSKKELDHRNHYFRRPVTWDIELGKQLNTLFDALQNPQSNQLEIQTFFYAILATLLQRHSSGDAFSSMIRETPDAVDKACEFINDMATSNITLDDIAKAAGLSRYHFLRVFQASRGMTPYSYLLQHRLQLAKGSMRKGMSIGDVAVNSGFFDQSHFTRRFKAAFGITPRQYQQAVC